MPRGILCLICLFVCAVPCRALKFRVAGEGNNKILLVTDCPWVEKEGAVCRPSELHFTDAQDGYEGDAAVFRRALHTQGVSEVWVISGGGNVQAAVEMARDLRVSGFPVRVPSATRVGVSPKVHPYCVSACTIFFMGGVIRRIDPGATYQVHSASSWSGRVDWQSGGTQHSPTIDPKIVLVAEKPERLLPTFVEGQQESARVMALQLLRIFQNTLLVPTRRQLIPENDTQMEAEATASLPTLTYAGSHQEQLDVGRIHAEGRAAVQDILMRIEREEMGDAIRWLQSRTDLGYRADTAIEMLRMMYMESIRETSTLSESELERRGYVTPEVR